MYNQTLNGEWQLSKAGSGEAFSASVPGCAHTDLLAAGVIADPFYADNEYRVAWVAETDWVYRRTFVPDQGLLEHEKIVLECDGLETLARISINGQVIASTDNMFRSYCFDVKNVLQAGENEIQVEFESCVKHTEKLLGSVPTVFCPGDSIPGSPYLRNCMCQWGWDWGPKLPTCGIWRAIRLVGYSGVRVKNIRTSQKHVHGLVDLAVDIAAEFIGAKDCTARVTLTSPDGNVVTAECSVSAHSTSSSCVLVVDNPQLWWPNGYGEQPLYDLKVELLLEDKLVDCRDLRVGLRTLELVQEPDQWGKTFYFRVNGVPIFCKGADWIPADQFMTRIADEQYRDLIACAADANMNMLRIWGGGIYEDDRFFDLCDEYGILIWHDFMFSCAHYPVHEAMLENIRLEAIDNIRRIRHHPCLALWCGNNEMEWGVAVWWNDDHRPTREQEYTEIFHKLLPEICADEDPATPYWPSSPSSGIPFVDPNDQTQGDSHYWDVWSGMLPFTEYRNRYDRFMSEFGFQAMPTLPTVKQFAPEDQWNLSSYLMDCHQKQNSGNIRIVHYFAATYRFPCDFESTVYLSQIQQAEAIRYGVEHWRRNRNGNRCMGTLYWQYNDCWPVSSWSSIDYYHRWKALHYSAKRFFAPVLLSAEESETGASLHLTNDTLLPFRGKVLWSLETLEGQVVKSGETQVNVGQESSALVISFDFSDYLDIDTKRNAVLVFELHDASGRLSMGMTSFVPSKYLELPSAPIDVSAKTVDGVLEITLLSRAAQRFVMLEAESFEDLRFSDNYFDLPAGRSVTVTATIPEGADASQIAGMLRARSLRDTY